MRPVAPRFLGALCLLVTLAAAPGASAEPRPLPSEAADVVAEYQRAAAAIRAKADAQLAPVRASSIERLQALQDRYTREAKLDEAVAIREAIRELRNVLPDPGALRATAPDIGKVLIFEVTGSTEGSVWGSELYTVDSHVGTAAVHAGVLAQGQTGLVKVRVLQGQKSYRGSTQHGVTTMAYGPWAVSFSVERYSETSP